MVIAHRHAALLLQVTIAPREKYPLGQTVLKVNEQRERTHMFTRRYLEEQLYTTLAGEQLVLLTSIHHPSAVDCLNTLFASPTVGMRRAA